MKKYTAHTHDPLILELLAAAEADPRTETVLCIDAGHGTGSYSKLRRALGSVNMPKFRDLGDVVGLELCWRRKDGKPTTNTAAARAPAPRAKRDRVAFGNGQQALEADRQRPVRQHLAKG